MDFHPSRVSRDDQHLLVYIVSLSSLVKEMFYQEISLRIQKTSKSTASVDNDLMLASPVCRHSGTQCAVHPELTAFPSLSSVGDWCEPPP